MVHTRGFHHEIDSMSPKEKTVWIINAIRIMEELDEKLKIYARKIIELGGNKHVEDERNSVHDEINMMSPGHSRKRRKTIGVGGKTRRRGKKAL